MNYVISVIIPTHNRSDALDLTLQGLAKQNFDQNWEVIVVNNNCVDDTDEVVKKQKFPVSLRLLHEPVPGPAAARNKGAFVSKAEFIVFIDNDILVEPDFLQRHLNSLKKYAGCWIVGQTRNLPKQDATYFGEYRLSLCPHIPVTQAVTEAMFFIGANSSLPRKDFLALGGFDSGFKVASTEDGELMVRAKEAGIKVLFDPSIVVIHNDWSGFTIKDYCWRQRLYSRSEYYFWRKYGEKHQRIQLVKENLPPNWKEDNSILLIRKCIKVVAGTELGQKTLIGVASFLEQYFPKKQILWRTYQLALSGAIYKGFQEGMAEQLTADNFLSITKT